MVYLNTFMASVNFQTSDSSKCVKVEKSLICSRNMVSSILCFIFLAIQVRCVHGQLSHSISRLNGRSDVFDPSYQVCTCICLSNNFWLLTVPLSHSFVCLKSSKLGTTQKSRSASSVVSILRCGIFELTSVHI